jgi:hypothetical protein
MTVEEHDYQHLYKILIEDLFKHDSSFCVLDSDQDPMLMIIKVHKSDPLETMLETIKKALTLIRAEKHNLRDQ